MATEKEGMVNGSSSTSRVSSNFAPARTAPGVHSIPYRRFYFLQMESEVSAGCFCLQLVSGHLAATPAAGGGAVHDQAVHRRV